MEKKLNNGNDGSNSKSIYDHERRRQAEKSRAVEQQRRTRTIDGPRLVRDVMIKLGLQRQPAEREHINMKIFEASVSLEKLTSADHAREDQRNFESPIPEQQFLHDEAEGLQAYKHGYTADLKAQEMTVKIQTYSKATSKAWRNIGQIFTSEKMSRVHPGHRQLLSE